MNHNIIMYAKNITEIRNIKENNLSQRKKHKMLAISEFYSSLLPYVLSSNIENEKVIFLQRFITSIDLYIYT